MTCAPLAKTITNTITTEAIVLKHASGNWRCDVIRLSENQQSSASRVLFPLALTLNNRDVAIDGQFCESFRPAAGLRPLYFQPVNLGSLSQSQNHPRIVSGEIAASAYLELMALQIARLICDLRADGVDIGLRTYKPHAQPVILPAQIVAQKNGHCVVLRHEHVYRTIIIKIAESQSAA